MSRRRYELSETAGHRSDRRGLAAVELALVLPLLLLVFAAAVDCAHVYYRSQVVVNCARVGAAFAANPDVSDLTPYATAESAALASAADLRPAPTVAVTEGGTGMYDRYVDVTVTYPYSLVLPWTGMSQVTLRSTARARMYPAAALARTP